VFIGDKVYAVTNLGVRAAAVSDVSTVENELYYGLPFVEEPPIILEPQPAPLEPTKPVDGGDPTTIDDADVSNVGGGSVGDSTTVYSVP